MKKIYIVRHCSAKGQQMDAPLTEEGRIQSKQLAKFFLNKNIDLVVSSPFLRAQQSIQPFIQETDITLELDERLGERVLSKEPMSDWRDKLKSTFINMDLIFDGGESSREATTRALSLINQIIARDYKSTVIVTHGNLMALILHYYDHSLGFELWEKLTNPDVYCITFSDGKTTIERVWNT